MLIIRQEELSALRIGEKLETNVAATTLGARGLSCVVSNVGHVCIMIRFASAAEAKRSISVRRAREKSSGTQGRRREIFFLRV